MDVAQLQQAYAELGQRVQALENLPVTLESLQADYAALTLRVDALGPTELDLRFFVPYANVSATSNAKTLTLTVNGPAGSCATVNWPEGTKPPPGNVTWMRSECPAYIVFTLPDGSFAVFTGSCKLVSGGARLLQSTEANAVIKIWFVKDIREATEQAAADFAAKYPYQLNWTDRRPIGKSFPYRASGIPRNWLWTWTTQAEFEAGYHAHIDACIVQCKSVDAQGLIVWALEGEPFGHPISYIADPEFASVYSPEVTPKLTKSLFAKITDSGLRAGVCIRPTQIRPVDWNVFKLWQFTLADNQEYYNELNRKIRWAHDELGCTLFYMDSMIRTNNAQSPIPPGTSALIPFELFAELCDEWPDCLLIPEQASPAMYSKCAMFGGGITPMDPVIKKAYPNSFRFMHGQKASYPRDTEILRASMAEGNIGTFNAWYPSPEVQALQSILNTA